MPENRPVAAAQVERRYRAHAAVAPLVRAVSVLTLMLLLPLPGRAQPPAESSDEVFALRLTHRRAQELLPLVEPLLSPNGTVELHTGWNLLVFHDEEEALERIRAFVADFDHPPRRLSVDIVVLRATEDPQAGTADDAPPWLAKGVGKLLNFPSYRTFGRARIGLLEGQNVEYSIGGFYAVRFEAGNVIPKARIRLRRFEILGGRDRGRRIFAADLSLHLDKPLVLGFARDEETGVELAVALLCRLEGSDVGGAVP